MPPITPEDIADYEYQERQWKQQLYYASFINHPEEPEPESVEDESKQTSIFLGPQQHE